MTPFVTMLIETLETENLWAETLGFDNPLIG